MDEIYNQPYTPSSVEFLYQFVIALLNKLHCATIKRKINICDQFLQLKSVIYNWKIIVNDMFQLQKLIVNNFSFLVHMAKIQNFKKIKN
jgi:hypothetical protein